MSPDQIGIAVFGVAAVFLSQDPRREYQRWACIFGLLGQVFWFYCSFKAEQWGIFALCFFYTFSWLKGLRNFWFFSDNSTAKAVKYPDHIQPFGDLKAVIELRNIISTITKDRDRLIAENAKAQQFKRDVAKEFNAHQDFPFKDVLDFVKNAAHALREMKSEMARVRADNEWSNAMYRTQCRIIEQKNEELASLKAENAELTKKPSQYVLIHRDNLCKLEALLHVRDEALKVSDDATRTLHEKITRLTASLAMAYEVLKDEEAYWQEASDDYSATIQEGGKIDPELTSEISKRLSLIIKTLSDPTGQLAYERWKRMDRVCNAIKKSIEMRNKIARGMRDCIANDTMEGFPEDSEINAVDSELEDALEALDASGLDAGKDGL